VPEALAYSEALEVPAELAEKVTEIEVDGGNEIYLESAPDRDGEEALETLRARGIEADWL